MLTYILVFILFIFVITVPWVIAIISKGLYSGSIPEGHGDRIAELSATIRYILFTIPMLVAVLGFLGLASYHDIIAKVTSQVVEEIRNTYSLDESRKIKAEADSLRNTAKKNYTTIMMEANAIAGIRHAIDSTLQVLIDQQIDAILPVGAIVAYYGRKEDLSDKWAICDGLTYSGIKTPNLREKFILGADWGTKEKSSSKPLHEQLALVAVAPSKQDKILLKQAPDVAPRDVLIPTYKISPSLENTNPLPPYYALVYIMKVK